jgi:DNA-directed RNA polymerase specialized sigma24 family protein
VAKKQKPNVDAVKENSLAVEIGRISKLFALYLLRDVKDEGDKITQLNAVGFSASDIAALLDKTENNVRVRISISKTNRSK